jgi:hypothetical protein
MSNIRYTSRPSDASNEDVFAELALDLKWTNRHALRRQFNPSRREQTKSPWAAFQTVSGDTPERIASEAEFKAKLGKLYLPRNGFIRRVEARRLPASRTSAWNIC